jgi:hypothetical protein
MVAENPDSFYLIAWREGEIPFHPGLFIFPRINQNDTYLVIPASIILEHPGSTPTAAPDILPTFTSTITPTSAPGMTPTFTPLPAQP